METRIETYIPLYRKYRPQSFADLIGQAAISQTLGNAINLNKVAHAYLFCGPRGTGKTSTARIFAKSLNCEQGPTVTPCQTCASCLGIAQGNALDVVEFDAASNNGVGDARELIENCQYSSMSGRFKVYIIDEVHMLTPQAFNALLKTLEEPPANVIFIFATTEAHKVLPTIISRCQRFDFTRITTQHIAERIRYIATQEAIAIDDEAVALIARHARGGLRDAVGLLDQVSVLSRAQADKVVSRTDVALFIGTLEEERLLRLSQAIAEKQAPTLLEELSALMERGIEPLQLLKDFTLHLRNLLIVQASGPQVQAEQLELAPDYFEQLKAQTALFPSPEELPQIIGRLASIERNVRHTSQPQLWLEIGFLELTYRHEINVVNELSERVAQLEAALLNGGASRPATMPATQARQTPTTTAPAKPFSSPPPRPVAAEPTPKPSEKTPDTLTSAAASTTPPQAIPPSAPMQTQNSQPKPQVAPPQPVAIPVQNHIDDSPATETPLSSDLVALNRLYDQAAALIPSLMLRALIQQQTFPIRKEDNTLWIGCVGEPNLTTLKKPDKLIHLQKALEKVFGQAFKLEIQLEKKKPSGPASDLKPESPKPGNVASTMPSVQAVQTTAAPRQPAPEPGPTAPAAPQPLSIAPHNVAPEPEEMPPLTDDGFDESHTEVDPRPPVQKAIPATAQTSNSGMSTPISSPASMPSKVRATPSEELAEETEEGGEALTVATLTLDPTLVGDPELAEAKKHAVELLQGKILE